MLPLLRTNDPVLISFVEALLGDAGIPHLVLDSNMSMMEGSIGILARRVMIEDEDLAAARRVLVEAGLEKELSDDAARGGPSR